MLYLTLSAILSAGRADVFPWWGIGYGLLALHHIVRVYEVGRMPLKNSLIIILFFRQVCNVGALVSSEVERTLTMLAQFAFIHGNNDLLCFAMARRSDMELFSSNMSDNSKSLFCYCNVNSSKIVCKAGERNSLCFCRFLLALITRRPYRLHGSLSAGGVWPLEMGLAARSAAVAALGAAVLMHFRLAELSHGL